MRSLYIPEFNDLLVVSPDRLSRLCRHVKPREAILDIRVFPSHDTRAERAAPRFISNRVTNVVIHVLSFRRRSLYVPEF